MSTVVFLSIRIALKRGHLSWLGRRRRFGTEACHFSFSGSTYSICIHSIHMSRLNGDLREWTESEASGASTDVSEGIERVVVAVRAKFDAIVAVST